MALITRNRVDDIFYGSPITKNLVFFTSTTTLLNYISSIIVNSKSGLIWQILNIISLPTPSKWMMSIVLLYWTRPLERIIGSVKFMHLVLSSYVVACGIQVGIALSQKNFLSVSGTAIYLIIGVMVTTMMLMVRGSHAHQISGIRISSHLLLILLTSILATGSLSTATTLVCGVLGALTTYWIRPLPLPPSLIQWVTRNIKKITQEKAPPVLSGATLTVQRQQRMDMVEAFLLSLQQRNVQPQMRGHPYVPTEEQIRQLTIMGFRVEQARHALTVANGNLTVAIQLLTTNRRE